MKRPSDETLMAFADRRLSADEHAQVAAYLEGDADARRLVETFKTTADVARMAYSDDEVGATPQHLIDLVVGARAGNVGHSGDDTTVVPLTRAGRRSDRQSVVWPGMAMAASIALIIGVGGGYLASLGSRQAPDGSTQEPLRLGAVDPSGAVFDLLEERRTGEVVAIKGDSSIARNVVVIDTFKDKLGRYCREFEAAETSSPHALDVAIACREHSGWTIQAAVRLARQADTSPDGAFKPATGAGELAAIEGLGRIVGVERNLTADEEATALASDWK